MDAPVQTCKNKRKWEVAKGEHERAVREYGGAGGEHRGSTSEHRGSSWPKRALAREQSNEA